MADSILSSVLSKAALTIVEVGKSTNLAEKLKVSTVTIKYKSRVMRHQKENGSTVVDVRIVDPVVVDLDVIAPSFDELGVLKNFLLDRKETFTLTSKGVVVKEVVCGAIDIQQNASMLSASPARITFKQFLRQGGPRETHKIVEQPADSSVFNRGIQTVTKKLESVQDTFRKSINPQLVGLFNG